MKDLTEHIAQKRAELGRLIEHAAALAREIEGLKLLRENRLATTRAARARSPRKARNRKAKP